MSRERVAIPGASSAEGFIEPGVVVAGVGGDGEMSGAELAELVGAFHGVAQRLQQTQETLRHEVGRLERELSESQRELKRARELAALGEMAAGIAHEIRNPLGSMKLYACLLVDDLADRPSERTTARKIAEGVDRVNEIVTDVLALARDLRVEARWHGLRGLVESALAMCEAPVLRSSVRVEIDRSIGDAGEVWCDGSLMRQVLGNLVRNACEAIGEWGGRGVAGGVVRIAHERRGVLSAEGRRRMMDVLSVRDDGPGIAPEAIDRAFNPFYTTRGAGTGLGLAIVHRVLDAHAGGARIFRNDAEGGGSGTTVELLIPMRMGSLVPAGGRGVTDDLVTESGASS